MLQEQIPAQWTNAPAQDCETIVRKRDPSPFATLCKRTAAYDCMRNKNSTQHKAHPRQQGVCVCRHSNSVPQKEAKAMRASRPWKSALLSEITEPIAP
uniref:Uncharacterized protein n=1 Tax=Anopheles albimanus TaxID=7167 RepID=A0A182FBU3_ANOAL